MTPPRTPGQVAREMFDTLFGTTGRVDEEPAWERIAQAVLADQWRPMREPPPNESDEVFLQDCHNEVRVDSFFDRGLGCTHWMPIPPLPTPPEPTWEENQINLMDKFGAEGNQRIAELEASRCVGFMDRANQRIAELEKQLKELDRELYGETPLNYSPNRIVTIRAIKELSPALDGLTSQLAAANKRTAELEERDVNNDKIIAGYRKLHVDQHQKLLKANQRILELEAINK
jgi:hypothetical protein